MAERKNIAKNIKGFEDYTFNVDFDLETRIKENEREKNTTEEISRKTFKVRIDNTVKKQFQRLMTEFCFLNELVSDKQSNTYVFAVLLHNLQRDYKKKYKTILELNKTDREFFSNIHTKGMELPPGIVLENPVIFGIITTEDQIELYKKLMNTFYKNELKTTRYSMSFYFYELVRYFKENKKDLELI